jgi:hypothetical protein
MPPRLTVVADPDEPNTAVSASPGTARGDQFDPSPQSAVAPAQVRGARTGPCPVAGGTTTVNAANRAKARGATVLFRVGDAGIVPLVGPGRIANACDAAAPVCRWFDGPRSVS